MRACAVGVSDRSCPSVVIVVVVDAIKNTTSRDLGVRAIIRCYQMLKTIKSGLFLASNHMNQATNRAFLPATPIRHTSS